MYTDSVSKYMDVSDSLALPLRGFLKSYLQKVLVTSHLHLRNLQQK